MRVKFLFVYAYRVHVSPHIISSLTELISWSTIVASLHVEGRMKLNWQEKRYSWHLLNVGPHTMKTDLTDS